MKKMKVKDQKILVKKLVSLGKLVDKITKRNKRREKRLMSKSKKKKGKV